MHVSPASLVQEIKKIYRRFCLLDPVLVVLFSISLFLAGGSNSNAGEILYVDNSPQTKNQFTEDIVLVDDSGESVVIPDSYCETTDSSEESSGEQTSERNISKYICVVNCGFAAVNKLSFHISPRNYFKNSLCIIDSQLIVSDLKCTNLQRAPPNYSHCA